MFVRGLQSEFIAERAESEQAAACDITEITIVSKLLPGKRIAQVDLDKRNLNGQQGVAQGNARVREATRV